MRIRQKYITSSFSDEIKKTLQSGNVSFDDFAVKTIFVFDRRRMIMLASTVADKDTGYWECSVPFREDESLVSMCRDEGNTFNTDIYDRTSLCSETYSPSTYHNSLIF